MAVSESEPRKMANCFLSSGYCQLSFPTTLEVSLENLEYFTNEGFEIHLGLNDYLWESRHKSMIGIFLIEEMWSLVKVRTKNVM